MKTIGIKLADGSFYPVLEDNTPSEKKLELTTAHNNQTKVMVDLYRSATCSMEDAEYVDSLQIENLNAHPNGEPEIKFTVSLDEDNQLSAKIVDSETGNESNTTITLVSRTLEERLITDEYDINDSEPAENNAGTAVAGAVAAGGLLAAAAALREKELSEQEEPVADSTEEIAEPEETVIEPEEEITVPEPEIETVEEEAPVLDETFVEEPVIEETSAEENPAEEVSADEASTDELPAEEVSDTIEDFVETSETGSAEEETEGEDAAGELGDMDFDLPDETENEFVDTVENTGNTETSDELPDMNFDLPDDTANETTEIDTTTDNTEVSDELSDMSFDFPESSDETEISEPSADDTITDDSSLSDMDFDIPDETTESEPQMPDDFFNTDDLDTPEENMNDPMFDTDSPAAGGLNFDGLYDEETERGTPAENTDDDVKKKTKVPVIICIICAIICILATLLILFIIPSKYNLITKKHAKETVAVEAPAPEPSPAPVVEPEPEPEPAVPEAKEDEIIIIEKAEEVVPAQPPVAEEKPKNITYKIKWGDTLWDIADTYYKNPWRYKYIARYNGIRNPDYIISGTIITIPAQ